MTHQLHPPLRKWASEHTSVDFKEVVRLTLEQSPNDPPEKPFQSLYTARELLKGLQGKLEACPGEFKAHEDFTVLSSCVQLELGLNYINSEEVGQGEELLESCLGQLHGLPSKVKTAAVSIQALNQLGILWGNRDEQQKALECLLKAKAVYESHVALAPPITDSQWLTGDQVSEPDRERAFESKHTLTLFYLAQVYGNLNQPRQSAQYCQTTLGRQLEAGLPDPVEWGLNCATLSQYYITAGNFPQARHCLAAASRVLQQFRTAECNSSASATTGEDPPPTASQDCTQDSRMAERRSQTEADVSRCWTKYCISLLSSSQDGPDSGTGATTGGGVTTGSHREKPRHKLFKFDDLELSDIESSVPCDLVTDYGAAKTVFLVCQKHINTSRVFYSLEEYASEHVMVMQDYSNAFKLLAHFEGTNELKCRMHKRRIDLLTGLQRELNPRHYLNEHRQFMYEIGEAQTEMACLKIVSADDGGAPTPHAIGKINKLLLSAIRTFEQFVGTFHETETGALPRDIDIDYLRPILYGKLNVARLFSKIISPDPVTQKSPLQKSLEQYKWLVEYCNGHQEQAEKVFADELLLCKEMVELLPHQMAAL